MNAFDKLHKKRANPPLAHESLFVKLIKCTAKRIFDLEW